MQKMGIIADQFQDKGYYIIEQGMKPGEIEEINQEAIAICGGKKGAIEGVKPVEGEADESVLKNYLCIHFPHKVSEVIRDKYLGHPAIIEVLKEAIGPNVKCMQSMLFMKNAGKPGQAWHQDEFYIPTRDRSLCGAWIALDDATVENGCLWVIPGSHKPGIIWPQRPHQNPEYDFGQEACDYPYSGEEAVPVEVKRGSIVFFNGYLLHRSLKNRALSGFRRALVNHYMRAESMLPWNWDGRLDPKQDMRDIVMVAGVDPYAYKGLEDLNRPWLRPTGEGGCDSGEGA